MLDWRITYPDEFQHPPSTTLIALAAASPYIQQSLMPSSDLVFLIPADRNRSPRRGDQSSHAYHLLRICGILQVSKRYIYMNIDKN
ncbi:hypothetical protein LA080_014559 [Diaporthe eres]|nr:hypothetical protein LA080_014559 [Diaporthe eres]